MSYVMWNYHFNISVQKEYKLTKSDKKCNIHEFKQSVDQFNKSQLQLIKIVSPMKYTFIF